MINSKNPHAFTFLKKVTIDYERNPKRNQFFFLRRISFVLLLLSFFKNKKESRFNNFYSRIPNKEKCWSKWNSESDWISVLRKKRGGKERERRFSPLTSKRFVFDCVEQERWKRISRNEVKIHRDRVSRFLTFSIRFDRVEFTLTYLPKVSLFPRPKKGSKGSLTRLKKKGDEKTGKRNIR